MLLLKGAAEKKCVESSFQQTHVFCLCIHHTRPCEKYIAAAAAAVVYRIAAITLVEFRSSCSARAANKAKNEASVKPVEKKKNHQEAAAAALSRGVYRVSEH